MKRLASQITNPRKVSYLRTVRKSASPQVRKFADLRNLFSDCPPLPTTYNNVHECSTKFVLCTKTHSVFIGNKYFYC